MAAIQVKNVPEELHAALRRRAAEEGVTVSAYVLEVLRRDLQRPSQRAWLAQVMGREPVADVDVVGALDAERRQRDEELDAAHRG